MRRSILLFAFCLAASAQPSAELARASKSPYDLARYIDAHTGFSWEPLWQALGIGDSDARYLFPCEKRTDCTSELITFLDPDQTIVHIQAGVTWDTYLRYLGTPAAGWRFAGAYTPTFRYFPRRHETLRLGKKPFLRVSTQGVNGSDVGSEIENWFDLTEPDFKPVFSFSPQGWGLDHMEGPPVIVLNHRYTGFVTVDEDEPGEAIRLSIEISFQAKDDSSEYGLGSTNYVGVYRRDPGQKKFTLRSAYPLLDEHAPIPNQRFERLVGRISFKDEEVLIYMLDRFKRIASGPATPEKRWLTKFVAGCKDTPEKRALQTLLR